MRADGLKQYFQPMICDCRYDYRESGVCLDINECQESHMCPMNSNCQNMRSTYECHCDLTRGYVNKNTDLTLVLLGGMCSLLNVTLRATTIVTTSFVMSVRGSGNRTTDYQLFLVDDNGGKTINPQCKDIVTFNFPQEAKSLTPFTTLDPSMQFQVMMKYRMEPTEYWSKIIITKCSSSGNDDTRVLLDVRSFQIMVMSCSHLLIILCAKKHIPLPMED